MKNSGPGAFVSPYTADADLGPAMMALNPKQRAFVDYIVTGGLGKGDWTEAARAAGYKDTPALRVQAHRLAQSDLVRAAIKEECERRLHAKGLPMAVKTILEIAGDPTHKDAAKVGLAVLAMHGMSPIAKSETKHTVALDMDQFRRDCLSFGYDPDEMLKGRVVPMKDVTPQAPLLEHQPEPDVADLLAEAGIEL